MVSGKGKRLIMEQRVHYAPAGLFRRLGALVYDGIIIIAIECLAAALVFLFVNLAIYFGLFERPTAYIDIADFLTKAPVYSDLFLAYLLLVWVGFFAYFWSVAGQTIGMRAWKLRVQNKDGSNISITQAIIRLSTSAFGLGNLLLVFDPEKRGFQDIWAKSYVVKLD